MLGWQPEYADFFSRPVRLYSWVDTSVPITSKIFTDWITNTAVAAKLANYQGFTGTLCVRIQHNGSAFRIGKRLWALDMELASDPNVQGYTDVTQPFSGIPRNAFQVSTMPIKAYTTPWTSETIDMKIPYMYNANFYSKTTTGPVLISLPLVTTYSMDGAAITNPMTFVVYAWMENFRLVKPSKIQSDRENPYRSVSNLVGKATGVAKSFGVDTTAVDIAKKFGDKVATSLGYSKPTMPLTSNVIQAYAMSPTSTFNSDVAEVVVADGWVNEESVSAADLGFGSDDDTNIAKLAMNPGIIAIIPMVNPATDSCVWANWVRPTGVNNSGIFSGPPGTYIANAFNWWSGDIVYHFDIVANPFCKGLVRIEFDPGSYILPLVSTVYPPAINTVQSVIIDLNTETSATIKCPWNAPSNALRRSDFYSSSSTDPLRETNGTIALYVSSPLMIANSTTPTLRVIIWQSIENLRVYEFDQRNINGYTNQSNAVQSDSAQGFGVNITSVNQVCRINTTTLIRSSTVGATGSYWLLSAQIPIFPPGLYSNTNASRPPNTNLTDGAPMQTGLVYFSPMFLARRGGCRTKITLGNNDLDFINPNNITTVNRTSGPSVPSFVINRSALVNNALITNQTGATNYPKVESSARICELRNNRRSPMRFCDARVFGGASTSGGYFVPCSVLQMRSFNSAASPQVPNYIVIGYSGDDNYTLNQYWGTPSFQQLSIVPPVTAIVDIEDIAKPANEAAATLLSLTRARLRRQPQDDPSEDGDSESNDDLYSGVLAQPQSNECLPFTVSFRGPRARLTTQKEAEASSDSEDP